MDVAGLRARVLAANMVAHGVPATVRQPGQVAAVETVGIWIGTLHDENGPAGADYRKRNARRLMQFPRTAASAAVLGTHFGFTVAAVPVLPRQTVIDAAEATGGPVKRWHVEEIDREDTDHLRVIVVATTS